MEVPYPPQSLELSESGSGSSVEDGVDGSDSVPKEEAYIHTLPFELFYFVFIHAIRPKTERFRSVEAHFPKFNLTALALSQTCAQWRSILLGTPEIWAVIDINTPPTTEIVRLLELYLARSGDTVSLDISLSDSPTRDGNPAHIGQRYGSGTLPIEEELMRDIFDIFICQAYRWKKIDFYLDRTPPKFSFLNAPLRDLWNIDSMSINFDCSPGSFGASGASWDGALRGVWERIHKSPSLRAVHWQYLDALPSAPFPQLTKISLRSIDLASLFDHLPSCRVLQHLEIDRLLGPNSSLPMDPVQLPHLDTLIVRLITVEAAQLLDLLILPDLKELYLRHGWLIKKPAALEGLLSRSLCTLERFSLVDRASSEAEVIAYLNYAMPFFKKVKVCMLKLKGITERTVNALMPQYIPFPAAASEGLPPRYPLGEIVLPFPALQDLTLIGCFIKEDGLIGHMVMARQLLNCPLFVLEIELKGTCIPWLVLKKDDWILKTLIEDETDYEWRLKGKLYKFEWRVR
ncbi:hypothetical protein BDN72DRAFT_195961 [Pluteus cervinus]|uniref:Uncharacterized protein n=1 Tax=Pluteus cervinus TaxID=181527 RepID=A0ACD3AJ01_9AGAR|nr:hypothetical protein BDN72DRAFT_195961 [Pluteus cervinus]